MASHPLAELKVKKDNGNGSIAMPRAPFVRIIKGILTGEESTPYAYHPKISETALRVLMDAVGSQARRMISEAGLLRTHAKRKTLFTEDVLCREKIVSKYELF